MNIQTVAQNLKNTIASKEALLKQNQFLLRNSMDAGLPVSDRLAIEVTVKFLEINIDELRKILADVEKCAEQSKEFSTWAHWQQNPDRSGGQFTQDEIDNAGRWI